MHYTIHALVDGYAAATTTSPRGPEAEKHDTQKHPQCRTHFLLMSDAPSRPKVNSGPPRLSSIKKGPYLLSLFRVFGCSARF